ncbi:MAG: M16 family metallopeptidase [Burkholderiaceae bacterium]
MFKRFLAASAVALSLLPIAYAQTIPAGVTKGAEVEGVEEYRLANGLQVLLVPDDSKPTVTVNVTYRVGSRHENYGETGMAHLLEHLIFKGTPTTKDVWAEFTKRGLRANGTTSLDRTNYFASFAYNEDNLRWYLSWQADAMVNSFIARKDLDTEMTVVRNEMEMGENNPQRILWQKAMATAYQWHNYGKSTIGARSDVENVDIARLQAFYRTYYQPDNAVLVISGKFNKPQLLGWVGEFFGKIPKATRALPALYTLDPVQDGERAITLRRVGGVPLIYGLYHMPPGQHPDYAAVQALNLILGDTPTGRLHKRLVEKQLAASAFAFSFPTAEPGFTVMGAQLAPGQDLSKASAELMNVVESIAKEPITQEELSRAQTKWLKNWELGFTNPEQIGVALSEAIALGDWRLYFLARDRVRNLKLADVQRVAVERFVAANRTLATYIPTEKPLRAPEPANVDVAAMVKDYKGDPAVAQAEAFDSTPANIDARTQKFKLPSGMEVALLPKGSRGKAVSATLMLNLGDEKSVFGLTEVGEATAAMLNKGTPKLTRQQIQDRFDQLKAQVGIGGNATGIGASIRTTRENLPAVIALVGEIMRESNFPADALDEYKRQALAGLEEQRKDPEAIVENALARHDNPYKKGDPRYARTFEEMEAEIKALTPEKLKAFHAKFLGASSAQFGAAGDLDAAAVRKALETSFGNWKSGVPYVRVPQPLTPEKATLLTFKTPDKQNAYMQVQQAIALNDNDPEYAAVLMGNYMLGLGGNSRLWKRIREKEGLSYDVRSTVSWNNYEQNSQWTATAIFAPQNRARVETAFREEVARLLKDGFTQEELAEGRQGLVNFRRLSRAQDPGLAGGLASNLKLNRTFAVSQKVDDQLAALTLEQVNAAMRKHLKPEQFVFGFGGDFK